MEDGCDHHVWEPGKSSGFLLTISLFFLYMVNKRLLQIFSILLSELRKFLTIELLRVHFLFQNAANRTDCF